MLDIDSLRAFGANVEEGIRRVANREDLYLRLVARVPYESGFTKLREAIIAHNLEAGFQAAHGLKGICANLSLDPLTVIVSEVTEKLRAREDIDYTPYLEEIESLRKKLEGICA